MKNIFPLLLLVCTLCCASWHNVHAEDNPPPSSETATLNLEVLTLIDVSCFGLADGAVTVNASGGLPPYIYTWSNGMIGPVLIGLEAGVYTCTATDLLGETGEITVTIDEPLELDLNIISHVNIDCGTPEGSITVEAGGGTGLALYLWSNGATTPTIDNLDPGFYTVTTTDENLCIDIETIEITADLTLPSVNVNATATINCFNPEVVLDGTGSAVGGNIVYLWTTVNGHIVSGENTLDNCVVDEPGTYTLTVTDLLNSCSDSESIDVEADITLPSVVIASGGGVDLQIDCLTPEITLDGTGSDTGLDFLHLWTTIDGHIVSGENTLNPIVDVAGTYTLTISNAVNGCTNSDDVVVTADVDLPLVNIETGVGVDLQLDCLSPEVILSGEGSATGPDISYLWSTTDGNIVSGATTLDNCVVDEPGTYVLTVTDLLNGCTAFESVEVTLDITLPTATIESGGGVDLQIDCLTPEITLDASGSSSGGNFLYLWTTLDGNITIGENTLEPVVDAAGTYTLTVTNGDNGCTASDDVVVTVDLDLPTANAGVSVEIDCDNPTVTLDGSGSSQGANFIYLWTTLNGNIVAGENTLTPEVNAAGTYTLTVTNEDNGCTAVSTVDVTVDVDLPTVLIEAGVGVDLQIDCLSPEITLDASASASGPGITYLWATVNGNIVAGGNTLTPTVDAAGTYTLTVTDGNTGCSNTAAVTVTANIDLPTVIIDTNVDLEIDCINAEVILSGEGSSSGPEFTYLWTTVNGNIVAGANTLEATVDAAGDYTLIVTDTENGCTQEATVTVTVDLDLPTIIIESPGELGCNNSAITLNASASSNGPGYVYLWTTTNGHIVSGANSLMATVDAAGEYTLSITAPNGCSDEETVSVSGTPSVTVSVTGLTDVDCFGEATGEITVEATTGTAPFTYAWSNGMTTATVSGLTAGNYTVTVTDADGCAATINIEIEQPTELVATATATGVTQPGTTDGTASISTTGGTSPYTYLWSNGMTTANISGLAAGAYSFTVTDANGCTDEGSVIVPEFGGCALLVTATATNADCGMSNGTATATAVGGTGTLTYQWSNGMTTASISGLAAGDYEVTVTDEDNCEATASATVQVVDDIPPTVITQNITVSLDDNGVAVITATMVDNGSSDACGDVTLDIDITNFDCDDLGPSTVTLTVTDGSGNSATGTAIVTVVDDLGPVATCPDNITIDCSCPVNYDMPTLSDNCSSVTVLSNVLITGFPSGSVFPTGTTTVTYAIVANTGEVSTCSFDVTVVTGMLNVQIITTNPSCPGMSDGSATAVVSGGSGTYTYFWVKTAETTASITGLSAGVYDLIVTDSDGNVVMVSAELVDPTPVTVLVFNISDVCGSELGSIDITPSGGTPPYTFVWYDENGNIISTEEDLVDVPAGEYTVEITDSNGCTYTSGGLVVNFLTGTVNLTSNDANVEVFPNPTSIGTTVLSIDMGEEKEVSVELYDITGQWMATVLSPQKVLSIDTQVDLSQFAGGSYMLKVFANGIPVSTKKLVYVK